jgi:hypothetical protein
MRQRVEKDANRQGEEADGEDSLVTPAVGQPAGAWAPTGSNPVPTILWDTADGPQQASGKSHRTDARLIELST